VPTEFPQRSNKLYTLIRETVTTAINMQDENNVFQKLLKM